jgi:hypothetical protein
MLTSILPLVEAELSRYGMSVILILGVIIVFNRNGQNSCAIYLSGTDVLNNIGLTFLISISIYKLD